MWAYPEEYSDQIEWFLMENIIVTTHNGLVEWLRRRGVQGAVFTRVKHSDIRGKHVFGSLPIYLAAEAACYTIITIPHFSSRSYDAHADITADEMTAMGARMESFTVQKIEYR